MPYDRRFHITLSDVLERRRFYKLCEIHKKTPVSEYLFNKVAGLYPAILLKEITSIQVFSDEFCEIHQTLILHISRQLLLFYGKMF